MLRVKGTLRWVSCGWLWGLLVGLLWAVSAPLKAGVPEKPALQQARVYEQGMSLSGYWVSEKLDGVRAYWTGEQFLSRGGHEIAAPEWFTRGFPDAPMDGELWMGHQRFSQVSAAIRRKVPDPAEWQQMHYMLFDLPHSTAPFSQRVTQMRELVATRSAPFLDMVPQSPATDHEALQSQLDKVLAKGGEGLMLHHGDSVYTSGRTQALLKVKTHDDAEARVVGHREGKGKYRGQLGALVVETPDGRQFRLGTGFSDAERRNPPPVGSTVTYKYYGLTVNGLPRFASFLRVRNDEPEP